MQAKSAQLGQRRQVRAASSNGASSAFRVGQRIRVTKPLKVYNVPKHTDGVDLMGQEGTIFKNIEIYKEKVLSATHPSVVKFEMNLNGAGVKFQVHLVGSPPRAPFRTHMRVQ